MTDRIQDAPLEREPNYIAFNRTNSLSSALISAEVLCALSRSNPLHLRSVVLLISGAFSLAMSICLRNTDGTGIYEKPSDEKLRKFLEDSRGTMGHPNLGAPEFPNLRLAPPRELWKRAKSKHPSLGDSKYVNWFFEHIRNDLEHPTSDSHCIAYEDFRRSTIAVVEAIKNSLLLPQSTHAYRATSADADMAIAAASAIISCLSDNPPALPSYFEEE